MPSLYRPPVITHKPTQTRPIVRPGAHEPISPSAIHHRQPRGMVLYNRGHSPRPRSLGFCDFIVHWHHGALQFHRLHFWLELKFICIFFFAYLPALVVPCHLCSAKFLSQLQKLALLCLTNTQTIIAEALTARSFAPTPNTHLGACVWPLACMSVQSSPCMPCACMRGGVGMCMCST